MKYVDYLQQSIYTRFIQKYYERRNAKMRIPLPAKSEYAANGIYKCKIDSSENANHSGSTKIIVRCKESAQIIMRLMVLPSKLMKNMRKQWNFLLRKLSRAESWNQRICRV